MAVLIAAMVYIMCKAALGVMQIADVPIQPQLILTELLLAIFTVSHCQSNIARKQ